MGILAVIWMTVSWLAMHAAAVAAVASILAVILAIGVHEKLQEMSVDLSEVRHGSAEVAHALERQLELIDDIKADLLEEIEDIKTELEELNATTIENDEDDVLS